jgi:hypothetical protein
MSTNRRNYNFTTGGKINTNAPGSGDAVTHGDIGVANTPIRIIKARGHLHSGGTKMVLYQNNKEVCTSTPKYDKDIIVEMTECPKLLTWQKATT